MYGKRRRPGGKQMFKSPRKLLFAAMLLLPLSAIVTLAALRL
jgi:hypothetical protein